MRAVAREADVALGLVNYHYRDKVGLIRAALLRIEEQDLTIVEPEPGLAPDEQLRAALRRVVAPEFLTRDYLSLRLQLWALAPADEIFDEINATAQRRYRDGLTGLIQAARPDLSPAECEGRAMDINIVQNGVWLTALLGLGDGDVDRWVARWERIALGP